MPLMPAKYGPRLPLAKPEEDGAVSENSSLAPGVPLSAVPTPSTHASTISMMPTPTSSLAVALPTPAALTFSSRGPLAGSGGLLPLTEPTLAQASSAPAPAITFFDDGLAEMSGVQVTGAAPAVGTPGGTGGSYMLARAQTMKDNAAFLVAHGISPLV